MAAWLPVLSTDRPASGASGCHPIVEKAQAALTFFKCPINKSMPIKISTARLSVGRVLKSETQSASRRWGQTNQAADTHERWPLFPSFPSNSKNRANIRPLPSGPLKGPSGWSQRGGVQQTHHILKDQSQGFLGVDDVMEEHDVGMLQAFQKRCCRDGTDKTS